MRIFFCTIKNWGLSTQNKRKATSDALGWDSFPRKKRVQRTQLLLKQNITAIRVSARKLNERLSENWLDKRFVISYSYNDIPFY